MKDIDVARYDPRDRAEWDEFIRGARNGLFLFHRGYMEYHADRFHDHSLIIRLGRKVLGVLPAHDVGSDLVSHGGLTFGGLVIDDSAHLGRVIEMFAAIVDYLRRNGIRRLVYKQVPAHFSGPISSEDTYALFLHGARVIRIEPSFLVDLVARPHPQARRLRGAAKARASGVGVRESVDLRAYWEGVLAPTLQQRHGVTPTHALEEIELLRDRFQSEIRLFVAEREGRVVAGTVLYLYRGVCHSQYIAANEEGKATHALDLVFLSLLEKPPAPARFFSFGIASEGAGLHLNAGLAEWKESFGARSVPNVFYQLDAAVEPAPRDPPA